LNKIIKRILVVFALVSLGITGCSKETLITDYVVAIGEDKDSINKIKNIDVLVIDAEYFDAEDIAELKSNNVREIYSYLNIGSIENFRDYYNEYEKYTLREYENWPDERWIDVSNENWQKFIELRIDELSKKGVDGFFVDNTDVYYLYPSDEIFKGIVSSLSKMKAADKKVIINGGDAFVKKYIESGNDEGALFDGVNQEDVYTKYDFSNEEYTINNEEEVSYFTEYLDILKEKGYEVYALEYATDPKIKKDAYNYSKKHNYTCYVSETIGLTVP